MSLEDDILAWSTGEPPICPRLCQINGNECAAHAFIHWIGGLKRRKTANCVR